MIVDIIQKKLSRIENDLKETIKQYPEIFKGDYIIIPLYHPVAQIKKSEQLEQYKKMEIY